MLILLLLVGTLELVYTQGVIHWVAGPSREVDPLSIEVRLFDKLFNSEVGSSLFYVDLCIFFPQSLHQYNRMISHDFCIFCQNPAELEDWLADVNPQSRVVISSAYAVPSLRDAAVGDRFQFERLGKFWIPLGFVLFGYLLIVKYIGRCCWWSSISCSCDFKLSIKKCNLESLI